MTRFSKLALPLIACLVMLCACQAPQPLTTNNYVTSDQNIRAWKRLDAKDVGVAQVRVERAMDLDCAGRSIPIPVKGNYRSTEDAFAAYWAEALMSDLSSAGILNQKEPKVKLYNLIESVKMVAEPTNLSWIIKMEVFSSNGRSLPQTITYNAPTDSLKNMQEGCYRLAQGLDKAVAWSILRMVSNPRFEELLKPGLNFVPSMKGESITDVFQGRDEKEKWKTAPK